MRPIFGCNFDNIVNGCPYQGDWCPAERAIHLCNAMQVRFMGRSYSEIRDNFEDELQNQLSFSGYECFIFWTPEGEKADRGSKSHERIYNAPWYKKTTFHQALNDVLIGLNANLHSHDFLRTLSDVSESARSRVFRFSCETDALYFSALYPDTRDASPKDHAQCSDLEIRIPYPAQGSPAQFLDDMKKRCLMEKSLLEAVATYIGAWAQVANNSDLLEAALRNCGSENASIGAEEIYLLLEQWAKSLKHFGLMALFVDLNGFSSITYYLSPLDQEHLKSSMVIYWSGKEPGRYLQYLIQMLLGLNAAPILNQHTRSKIRDVAFINTGHLMRNRCDAIQRHLEEATGISLNEYEELFQKSISEKQRIPAVEEHLYLAMNSASSLSDCFQSLQLWGFDSLTAVWDEYKNYPEKLSRFFTKTIEPFDLNTFLYEDARSIIEERYLSHWGNTIVTLRIHKSRQWKYYLKPHLDLPTEDKSTIKWRLSDKVLGTIFFEIFLNALRHGMVNNSLDELEKGYSSVSIGFASDQIDRIPVVTVFNNVTVNSEESRERFETLPDVFEPVCQKGGRGLGLMARGLSGLGLGNIWSRRFENEHGNFYEVAVALKGLHVEEAV